MVSFTCNTCGDSLKKKEVALHFSRKPKCRAGSVSCFDCLKEFRQDYTGHTMCVSEDQRYSANGLSGVTKNKQQAWSEIVHKQVKSILVARSSTFSNTLIRALEYVCQSQNVPKKEKAFLNFLRNPRKFSEDDILEAWKIVQEACKQEDEAKKNNDEKNSDANGTTPTTNGDTPTNKEIKSAKPIEDEVASSENKLEDEKEQKKKKKKSKKVSESNEEMEKANDNNEVSGDLEQSKQKKKEKKDKSLDTSQTSEDIPMEVEEGASETKVEEEKLSKKERKLKKKQAKFEAELKAIEAGEVQGETEDIEEPAVEDGKKKKSKKHAVEAEENLETEKKSKKKRERTVSMAAETDQPKKKNKQKDNDENTEPNEVEEAEPSRKDFNWNDVIVQVLQSQDDKEMSIKRLCKKVVNEYLSSLLEGAHVDELKATAKFQKKLHKTPGVFVHKDKAKLKATD